MLQILMVGLALFSAGECDPTIQIKGDENYYLDCDLGNPPTNPYIEYGATAATICEPGSPLGNLTDKIVTTYFYSTKENGPVTEVATVDVSKPGYYMVKYEVTYKSAKTTKMRTVRVFEFDALFTLNGAEKIKWECNVPYEDAGATATSPCLGDLGEYITISGTEPMVAHEPGKTYTITLRLAHPLLERVQELTREVTIVDSIEPSISLKGLGEDKTIVRSEDYPVSDPEDLYYYRYYPRWYDEDYFPFSQSVYTDPDDANYSPPPYWRYYSLPEEKFFKQEYEKRYPVDKPVLMPEVWNIVEEDSDDGKEYYPWHCDIPYQDPGVDVYDDCEGRIDPDKVIIVLTRYLDAVRQPWYWWGNYWWWYYWDTYWYSRSWWNGWWNSWHPVRREVFQYVGTLKQLREDPDNPEFPVPYLGSPGEEQRFYTNADRNLKNAPYYLRWGGYRAYYFIRDNSENPAIRDEEGKITQHLLLRTLRSRFIRPEYGAEWFQTQTLELPCGEDRVNLLEGVRLFDKCIGDLTAFISVTGDYDPDVPGSYPIFYNGRNIYGQEYRTERIINVVDGTPPALELYTGEGEDEIAVPSPGAAAVNDYIPWCVWRDGMINSDGTTDGKTGWDWWENWFLLKPYQGFKATDACGNLDCTPSVSITGDGKLRESLEFMSEATAHLDEPNPWNLRPYVLMDPEDADVPEGRYPIWFSYKDNSLNEAGGGRIVNVLPTAPEIVIQEKTPRKVECGNEAANTSYPTPDFFDRSEYKGEVWQCSTDINDILIEETGAAPLLNKPGTYVRHWKVTNALWNTAEAEFSIIIQDTLPPVISILPEKRVEWEVGKPFSVESVATVLAEDQCDGVVDVELADRDNMDFKSPKKGVYELAFRAEDRTENSTTERLTVFVETEMIDPENDPPVITLLGARSVLLECGSPFIDPGASAADILEGDLTGEIKTTGSVDQWSTGSYEITYRVEDRDGHSDEAKRLVKVEDSIAPVISLRGQAAMSVQLNNPFLDPGATADDLCDGTVAVAVIGVVDTTKAGLYTLTYTARDSAGNEAFPITRQITVAGVSMEGEEIREGEGEAIEGEPAARVRVPNLVLERYENAPAILAADNLTNGGIVYQYSKEVPEGLVISQNPAAGMMVEPLTPVSLVVSEGPCACGCKGGEELSWSGIFLGALALLVLLAATFGVSSGAIK